jgi:hypothetical protein
MSYYEQTSAPFLVSPNAWHDPARFHDLALSDFECLECDSPIGWESVPMGDSDGQVWHDYWAVNEDMEECYCPQCYEEITKELGLKS